jgi:hypothetical protein
MRRGNTSDVPSSLESKQPLSKVSISMRRVCGQNGAPNRVLTMTTNGSVKCEDEEQVELRVPVGTMVELAREICTAGISGISA